MLVVKDGRRAAGAAVGVGDLEEHLETRIERLRLVVHRVVAVLADQQHAVDGKVVAAERERLVDRAEDRHPILGGHRRLMSGRIVSLAGPCSVYIETIFERGPADMPSCSQPSRYLPTATSA